MINKPDTKPWKRDVLGLRDTCVNVVKPQTGLYRRCEDISPLITTEKTRKQNK